MNKTWSIHTVDRYSPRKNEALTHTTAWMSLRVIRPNIRSQSQWPISHEATDTKLAGKVICRDRKQPGGTGGQGRGWGAGRQPGRGRGWGRGDIQGRGGGGAAVGRGRGWGRGWRGVASPNGPGFLFPGGRGRSKTDHADGCTCL